MVNRSVQSAIASLSPLGRLSGLGPPPAWCDVTAQVKILIGTASAMAFLHERNIIHLNLSPSSIFLDDYFEAKISGFGSVRAIPTPEGLPDSIKPILQID
jgi:hypothetical protein